MIAHCLLHLGLGHFQVKTDFFKWNIACDCYIAKFLADLKLGRAPSEMQYPIDFFVSSEERLYLDFLEKGVPPSVTGFGTAGLANADMIMANKKTGELRRKIDWPACFERGLSMAVTSAVNVATGYEPYLGADTESITPAVSLK